MSQIDDLAARFAVADLIHTYARLIRNDRPDEVADLFLPDGTFEIRDGDPHNSEYTVRSHLGSQQAVRDYLSPNKGRPQPVPLIRNMIVEVDGDTARSNCMMDARIYGTAHTTSGEYHDTCRKVHDRWYFASRIYTIYKGLTG